MAKLLHRQFGVHLPLWQPELFDHLLRSSESYSNKWEYVRCNSVRAGFVSDNKDWPYQGCMTEILW